MDAPVEPNVTQNESPTQDEVDDTDDTSDEGVWVPPFEQFNEFIELEGQHKKAPELPVLLPSEFTEFAFRMPTGDGMGFENFSFKGRRHMRRIYDTPAHRVLLVCARQVEKSTCLGNRAICYSCIVPGFRTLYVSPTGTQTKTFSNDRLKDPIETSPLLRMFTTTMLSQNIMEKQFINYSKIVLRNAFLNADRTRGIPAWMLEIDEFQDILGDNVPVIEQCTSHAPEKYRMHIYSGTPKSLDNNIEFYRSGYVNGHSMSSQGEWAVPCDCTLGEGGRYWNILGEKNIGKKGLICEKCGKLINPQNDDAMWANMVEYDPETMFESFRIPQLMVPWKPWPEVLLDYARYPRDKFYNEVLGISYDSGMRPLSKAQVKDACCDDIHMDPAKLEKYRRNAGDNPIFAGVDWGTGENSYTVVTLGTYKENKFRIIYAHRMTGVELEPPLQMKLLIEMFKDYKVLIIGTDYGGGFDRNDTLIRAFGPMKVAKFQYMARCKRKVEWEPKLRRFRVFRTEVMSDIFNAIKRMQIDLPRWEDFQEPYATDMCNIYSEYNDTLRMIQYDHRQDRPDDTMHSIIYCMLASMIKFPRPDIIAPLREDQNRGGAMSGSYSGPYWQG